MSSVLVLTVCQWHTRRRTGLVCRPDSIPGRLLLVSICPIPWLSPRDGIHWYLPMGHFVTVS